MTVKTLRELLGLKIKDSRHRIESLRRQQRVFADPDRRLAGEISSLDRTVATYLEIDDLLKQVN